MGILEQYEDAFYNAMDAIHAKGVPVYSIIDPIEDFGIKASSIGIAVIALLFIGFVLPALIGLLGGIELPGAGITIIVSGPDGKISGAEIVVSKDGEFVEEKATNSQGKATISKQPRGQQHC